jgi:hypothetical protein
MSGSTGCSACRRHNLNYLKTIDGKTLPILVLGSTWEATGTR